jgi:hypothetical protein
VDLFLDGDRVQVRLIQREEAARRGCLFFGAPKAVLVLL